jgi:hypothetical protein
MSSRHTPSKIRPSAPKLRTLEDDLLDPIPVSKAELDAIEQHFGAALNEIFDRKLRSAGRVDQRRSKERKL